MNNLNLIVRLQGTTANSTPTVAADCVTQWEVTTMFVCPYCLQRDNVPWTPPLVFGGCISYQFDCKSG